MKVLAMKYHNSGVRLDCSNYKVFFCRRIIRVTNNVSQVIIRKYSLTYERHSVHIFIHREICDEIFLHFIKSMQKVFTYVHMKRLPPSLDLQVMAPLRFTIQTIILQQHKMRRCRFKTLRFFHHPIILRQVKNRPLAPYQPCY